MAFDPMIEEKKEALLKKINFPGQNESVAGTTATVLLITPDEFICANAGDSRTVLSKNKQAIDLSHDHKPGDEAERARIVKAGMNV
jgi:serine/threonine protein phosphatase PrpC